MTGSVLSICPNKAMNYVIHTILNNLYHLTIVDDVFHGMNEIRQKKDISLIIIDLDYHTKESTDFILHISSSKLYYKPLIALVSAENYTAKASLLESCVYSFFIKPFNPIELVDTINSINSFKPSTSLS